MCVCEWGGSSVVSFVKRGLHSDAFQTHEMLFFLGGELSGYDYIATHAEEQRSDLLTYDQTDCELSQAQQKSGHLKGLANDVRPNLTNTEGLTDE